MWPTRLAIVLIISFVSLSLCSCLFCVVWFWFSWRVLSIACIMAAACSCLPVWLRWYPSCSIAVLPSLMVSSISTYFIPSSFAIFSKMSLSLTMLYVMVMSLIMMGGGSRLVEWWWLGGFLWWFLLLLGCFLWRLGMVCGSACRLFQSWWLLCLFHWCRPGFLLCFSVLLLCIGVCIPFLGIVPGGMVLFYLHWSPWGWLVWCGWFFLVVAVAEDFLFVFTPQPLKAPGYCRTPSMRVGGRAAGQTSPVNTLTSIIFHGSFSNLARAFITLKSQTSSIMEVLPH